MKKIRGGTAMSDNEIWSHSILEQLFETRKTAPAWPVD
jgi:hypothetical protein